MPAVHLGCSPRLRTRTVEFAIIAAIIISRHFSANLREGLVLSMPRIGKKSLTLFLRNGCQRQLVLSLYNDKELTKHGMPKRQEVRAGLGLVAESGYEWQEKKVGELDKIFGTGNVHISRKHATARHARINLGGKIGDLAPFQFLVEGYYEADTPTFRSAFQVGSITDIYGETVEIGTSAPDLIQVLPSVKDAPGIGAAVSGRPYWREVQPSGNLIELVDDDDRMRLRVIDIKLSSEPGSHYFAEVIYYSITLASWLVENGLQDRFVVVAAPAVWPGSHDASNLAVQTGEWRTQGHIPSSSELCEALEGDLEIPPFEVYVPRLRRLIGVQLPQMLSQPWDSLPWHVDYKCKGCEFLGYPWRNSAGQETSVPAHCLPTAEGINHLSRVNGLSRGASQHLTNQSVGNVADLAVEHPESTVFQNHQGLRAKRTVYPSRAVSLESNLPSVIPNSGGDALMPRFPDLHIYVFLDYDLSSAITAAIGLRAAWKEPLPFVTSHNPKTQEDWSFKHDKTDVFLVDQRDINRERDEFLNFLRRLKQIMTEVDSIDSVDVASGRRSGKSAHSTYQIYLWDESQRRHLIRLVGRHLTHILADPKLRGLAWLFPPPELLQRAELATRSSPVTIVADVVNNTVALPVAHHYTLLDVVANFMPAGLTAPTVHPLYQEPMSDLIPAERIHTWWIRNPNWNDVQDLIKESVGKKISALRLVTSRLESELRTVLSQLSAPNLTVSPPSVTRLSVFGRVWFEYSRLNAALSNLESDTIRSMPAHEREAKTKSARLTRLLRGAEEAAALGYLSASLGSPLTAGPRMLVYELGKGSLEINVRPGEMGYALSPEAQPGFLDDHPFKYVDGTSFDHWKMRRGPFSTLGYTEVSIVAIDRNNGFIALKAKHDLLQFAAESNIPISFSKDVMLDKVHTDFITRKLKLTLQGIGNPPTAIPPASLAKALGIAVNSRTVPESPASEVLWQAQGLHSRTSDADLSQVKSDLHEYLKNQGADLDSSQWAAWQSALIRTFSLIWGPPGTGKSRTIRAVLMGCLIRARLQKDPIRILITAFTNTALDNVLLELETEIGKLFTANMPAIYRTHGTHSQPNIAELTASHPALRLLTIDRKAPSPQLMALRNELDSPSGSVIVGCLPQQLHNLATAGISSPSSKDTQKDWFDVIVLDEASQMDIAQSTLVFSKRATNGACILAGDNLQLSPIQQAEPPIDLEHLVGSAFDYFRFFQGVPVDALNVNYRSNSQIVELTRAAGYSENLISNSPDLKLEYVNSLPTSRPADFPADLLWTDEFSAILDPDLPVCCYIYEDEISSQINDFECDSIAALLWLLRGRVGNQLLNERGVNGSKKKSKVPAPYTSDEFWTKAVGIVTPHRAQMAKIVGRLQGLFPPDGMDLIRDAVDTVERFQGQQRDVIFASFGVGDPDIVSSEAEFLFNLNRFNVLSSRSRAKLIVFVTQSLIEHLSDDAEVMKNSRFLKYFAEGFCRNETPMELGYLSGSSKITVKGALSYR